jgi:hypothetical protein
MQPRWPQKLHMPTMLAAVISLGLLLLLGGCGGDDDEESQPVPPVPLAVTVLRGGTVTSSPAGISCPGTCSADFPRGTVVTLTATPAAGSIFMGWGGTCSGRGPCTVTLTAAQGVTTNFFVSNLPMPQIGANGETISFSQLTDGSAVPCAGIETLVRCTFNVNFTVQNLRVPATAHLYVEIVNDANGDQTTGIAVFLQGSSFTLPPTPQGGQLTGTLMGTLGPPVTTRVRFNLAMQLLNQAGVVIASSERLLDLRPQ